MTHIRIGKRDWAPLIPKGEADVLLGFEPVEALRAAMRYAGERTIALVSMMPVPPSNVTSGDLSYPAVDDIRRELESICERVIMLDTNPVLERMGSTKVLNSYMIGALSAIASGPLDAQSLQKALSSILDSERDRSAFDEGVRSLK